VGITTRASGGRVAGGQRWFGGGAPNAVTIFQLFPENKEFNIFWSKFQLKIMLLNDCKVCWCTPSIALKTVCLHLPPYYATVCKILYIISNKLYIFSVWLQSFVIVLSSIDSCTCKCNHCRFNQITTGTYHIDNMIYRYQKKSSLH